ncbi:hypothetical protein [Prevotella amnii]|uniref:hypothetical protein n=1 Tax=Prevotella amnii TaxID=419005 RepID=UPI0003A17426|nr:hypothetical protein [Prevotella amnii]
MELIQGLSLIIALILMPFVTHGHSWSLKLLYIGICGFLTPIIGIPLYRHLTK